MHLLTREESNKLAANELVLAHLREMKEFYRKIAGRVASQEVELEERDRVAFVALFIKIYDKDVWKLEGKMSVEEICTIYAKSLVGHETGDGNG
jgi:hypothetical protein